MDASNEEQAKLWNGLAGRTWVEARQLLDRMFQPIEELLLDAALAASPSSVLDVGCGTGSTTLAAARRLAGKGRCVGVDISDPMIGAARRRPEYGGETARFICADAQVHAFEPAGFDAIISRFGVMFFDDPVAAFRNLRRAATDGAALTLAAWRSAEDNPFMTTAERAAAAFLPAVPARQQDAPGQFAFRDRQRVQRILEESGWGGIDIRPLDVSCTFPEQELVGYLTRLGPVGRILYEADAHTRAQVIQRIRAAFDPYVHGEQVIYNAACWMVTARAV